MVQSGTLPAVNRREFVRLEWQPDVVNAQVPVAEIASALVQARPGQLDDVASAIEALPGTKIYARDPKGKLVVVIEAADVGAIGTVLNTISVMPWVLSAALVFHGTEAVEAECDVEVAPGP